MAPNSRKLSLLHLGLLVFCVVQSLTSERFDLDGVLPEDGQLVQAASEILPDEEFVQADAKMSSKMQMSMEATSGMSLSKAADALQNIQLLKAYCTAARKKGQEMAQKDVSEDAVRRDIILALIDAFSEPDSKESQLVVEYAQMLATLHEKFPGGISKYLVHNINKAVLSGEGCVTSSTWAKLNYLPLGFTDQPKYLEQLAVPLEEYRNQREQIIKSTSKTEAEGALQCMQAASVNKYKVFLDEIKQKWAVAQAESNATAAAELNMEVDSYERDGNLAKAMGNGNSLDGENSLSDFDQMEKTIELTLAGDGNTPTPSKADMEAEAHKLTIQWAAQKSQECHNVQVQVNQIDQETEEMPSCDGMTGRYGQKGYMKIKVEDKNSLTGEYPRNLFGGDDPSSFVNEFSGTIKNVTKSECRGTANIPSMTSDAKTQDFIYYVETSAIEWSDGLLWEAYNKTYAPTAAPTTAAPTPAPTTTVPTTAAPTPAPTTTVPTSPTKVPYSDAATNATAGSPSTGSPTTGSPTGDPTTSVPTFAPTTSYPTLEKVNNSNGNSSAQDREISDLNKQIANEEEEMHSKSPTWAPTTDPTQPTPEPTPEPSREAEPSSDDTTMPTASPTPEIAPTSRPTQSNTEADTPAPVPSEFLIVTASPTSSPTSTPTTLTPTGAPTTLTPTAAPTPPPPVEVAMVLAVDLNSIPPGSPAREEFAASFTNDISQSLGIDQERVIFLGVSAVEPRYDQKAPQGSVNSTSGYTLIKQQQCKPRGEWGVDHTSGSLGELSVGECQAAVVKNSECNQNIFVARVDSMKECYCFINKDVSISDCEGNWFPSDVMATYRINSAAALQSEMENDFLQMNQGSDCKDDDAGLKSQSLGMIADCSTAMLGGKTTVCNYEPTKPNQEHAKLVTGHCQKSCGLCEAVQVKESKVDFEIKQEDSGNDDVGDVLKAQLEDPKSTLYEGDTTNKVVASKSVVTIPTLAPTAAPTASPTEAPSSAPTSFPTMAPTVNMEESARWVDVINYYRCLHGVPKVEWDNGMATSAQAWAESLNALKHDDTFHLPPPAGPAGENLARGQRKLEDAAKQWYSEISKCPKEAQLAPQAASLVQIGGAKPGGTKKMATMENQAALMQASGVPPAEKIKPGCDVDITKVGHFTAMVWKAAKKIGCGIHATRKIYVCRFKAGDELKGGETPNYGGRAFYDQNILPNSKTDQECPKPELAKGPLDVTCDDTAQDTLDEIEASVKAQQDALDLMDKGENCGSAGDDLIAATQHEKEKAAGLVLQSHAKVAAAEATTISMGSYTWKELVVDECENLFGDQYYAVSQSVTAAKNELGQDEGRLKAAKKAVERAPAEAALLVTQCQCEARHQHQEAVKAMNKEVEEVNTKAWKEAKLMLCTIKGVSSANCDTSGMPVVKPTTLAEGVADAFCAGLPFEGALGARNGVPAHKYVFQLEQPDYANNAANSYTTQAITQCAKHEMLPVCDHPSYCKDDGRSMYIGQDSHLSVQSVRENATPTGFAAMKEHWDGVCYYTSNANGPHALCATDGGGNPSSGHAWMRPSTLLNKDSKYFMCARIVHKSFTVSLGARNGVPAQTVQFRMITARNKGTGEINRNMLADCGLIGMKPVCDHPSYCKGDQDSFYVGQDHHFSHGPHRRSLNYFPAGWDKFLEHEQEMPGMCTYTAHHNGWASTLCGNPDSHAWRTSAQNHEFLCAKKVA